MNRQLSIFDDQQVSHRRSVPSWQNAVEFTRIDPAHNRYRSYRLELTQDLFGHWALVRSSGRIARSSHTKVEYFIFRFDAKEHAHRIVRRRLAHGYRIMATY